MNAQAKVLPGMWGDRTALIRKQMVYVCSLTLTAQARGRSLLIGQLPDDAPGGLRHLFGDTVATMPEGLRCDLPAVEDYRGQGELGSAEDPTSSRLDLRISFDIGGQLLRMECTGVATFTGASGALSAGLGDSFSGTAFVSTRQETSIPTYRWMNRRQLYGVGRVQGERRSGQRNLVFSFDLYAAG
jgi:hypothetical protein